MRLWLQRHTTQQHPHPSDRSLAKHLKRTNSATVFGHSAPQYVKIRCKKTEQFHPNHEIWRGNFKRSENLGKITTIVKQFLYFIAILLQLRYN
jgi:hypothetical protein